MYCGAGWAGDRTDMRSTSGVLMCVCSTTVALIYTKQQLVALPNTEGELLSLCDSTKVIIRPIHFLKNTDCEQTGSTTVLEESQGGNVWGTERVKKAKHVYIKRNSVLENVANASLT